MSTLRPNQRVMVACVSREFSKILTPARDLDVDSVHLFVFDEDTGPDSGPGSINGSSTDRYLDDIRASLAKEEVDVLTTGDLTATSFDDCMQVMFRILSNEKRRGSSVYVNISTGPPIFSAAASIASMMVEGVELFTVDGRRTATVGRSGTGQDTRGNGCDSDGGRYTPVRIDKFPLPTPNMDLLRALAVFRSVPEKSRSNVNVIRELIRNGLWKHSSSDTNRCQGTSVELENDEGKLKDPRDRDEYDTRERKEAVQYQRSYINKWREEGWIVKSDVNSKRYKLSETGNRYLDIFIVSDDV